MFYFQFLLVQMMLVPLLMPMMLLLPMMLKPTHEFFVVELQERVRFQTRWRLLMI